MIYSLHINKVPGPEQQDMHDEQQDLHDDQIPKGHRSRKMKNNCTRFYRSTISCCGKLLP